MSYIEYIQNQEHYNNVLSLSTKVKHTLWIGTADIKSLYVKNGVSVVPFLSVLSQLIRKNIKIRLMYAKQPGVNFLTDFRKYPNLKNGIEMVLCPRIHFKMLIFDLETAYIGSANLTGAGIGMKSSDRRNFETGILTNNNIIVNQAITQFDEVWMGKYCKSCGRKRYCKSPIA